MNLSFKLHPGEWSVHSLKELPRFVPPDDGWFCLVRSSREVTLICPSAWPVESNLSDSGWALIEVLGTFEFTEVGVMARISSCLAGVGVSILPVGTYETDYLLVKENLAEIAMDALRSLLA